MKIRLIQNLAEDHPMLCQWWTEHGFSPVPMVVLPKLGVIVESDEGDGVAAAFQYQDNSCAVCWVEWIVTNPKAGPFVAAKAIKMLLDFMAEESERHGYLVQMSTCRQDSLGSILKKNGFQETDRGVTHYLRTLKPGG